MRDRDLDLPESMLALVGEDRSVEEPMLDGIDEGFGMTDCAAPACSCCSSGVPADLLGSGGGRHNANLGASVTRAMAL